MALGATCCLGKLFVCEALSGQSLGLWGLQGASDWDQKTACWARCLLMLAFASLMWPLHTVLHAGKELANAGQVCNRVMRLMLASGISIAHIQCV